MLIKQILCKNIPKNIYRKGGSISLPLGAKDIYFKLDKDLVGYELWEVIEKVKRLPKGIMNIAALGQFNYIRVTYHPEQITEEAVMDFVRTIKF